MNGRNAAEGDDDDNNATVNWHKRRGIFNKIHTSWAVIKGHNFFTEASQEQPKRM